ncbi:DUF1284 domain-containing protein [bacterium]|nr:DUF1284 domain-containing protein [bacterium]
MMEPIRFRPHHFLCMLTYSGAGYTPEFVANFDALMQRINAGPVEIEIVQGPDDICGPMMSCRDHPDFHCENASVRQRDAHALREIAESMARWPGDVVPTFEFGKQVLLTAELIAFLREEFRTGRIRTGCKDCEWDPRCSERTADGFKGARLGT